MKGAHQSRNSFIARTLREAGIMRELGEGLRRIHELMLSSELAPPEISSDDITFRLALHHRAMYSKDETLWLAQYEFFDLSAEDKAIMLIGRRGELIAPNDIIKRLGIVDIEHYRKLIESLQRKKILVNTMQKKEVQKLQRKDGLAARDIARFKILSAGEITQRSSSQNLSFVKKSQKDSDPKRSKPSTKSNNDKTKEKTFDDATVYVANIPPNTTPRDLVFAFRGVGAVNSARVPQLNGLSRGYAFVEFESVEVAQKALVSAPTLGGRKLTLRWATPKTSPASGA